jgi:RNA polymerase sigma-70 factor (ECF subfamily)
MALQDIESATRTPLRDLAASAEFEAEFVGHLPGMRAFARSLSGKRQLGEDLAQEALAKAWAARGSFTPGTNLKAWLYAILRHEFYSHQRRAWRQAPWDGPLAATIAAPPEEQRWALELSDTVSAMRGLSDPQREALILVGAGGFSHDDAARLSKIAVGTVKSRVARARLALKELLDSQTALPIKSRPAKGHAMSEILAQLGHLGRMDAPPAIVQRRHPAPA